MQASFLGRRARSILAVAVSGSIVALAVGAKAQDESDKSRQAVRRDLKVLLFDGFDGKLGLNWQPVRHVPSHITLKTLPGMLTIRTQRGTIHRDEKAQGWEVAKNLFVIENPLAADADFTVTTRLHAFMPTTIFQQAGLLLYGDDDNYLKLTVQFNRSAGMGRVQSMLTETAAVSEIRHYPMPDAAGDVWLRLTKRGNSYAAAMSAEGKDFEDLESRDWDFLGPLKIGLVAKNGGGTDIAPEMDAHFDFFELLAGADLKAR